MVTTMSRAEEMLDFCAYTFDWSEGIDVMEELLKKGVRIRMIVDENNLYSQQHYQFMSARLYRLIRFASTYAHNFQVRSWKQTRGDIMSGFHFKGFCVDKKVVQLGGRNWSMNSLNNTTDGIVTIACTGLGQSFTEQFEDLWIDNRASMVNMTVLRTKFSADTYGQSKRERNVPARG